jgi:FkbM family methyltransferase
MSTPSAFVHRLKKPLLHPALHFVVAPIASLIARAHHHGVHRIFYDDGLWIHHTSHGYFVFHEPYLRLDLAHFHALTHHNFFWGYSPRSGDTVLDIGAGAGEETLTLSRSVGPKGRVICVEAHPRTFRCLEKLVSYNHFHNVTALHRAIAEPGCALATIQDSSHYLTNRLQNSAGISVPATTLDALYHDLRLGLIHFLKMNIEGAERLAIQGMTETLQHTAIVCISCHDFLAASAGDDSLCAKSPVRQFLLHNGFSLASRSAPGLAPYLYDQVWAFNALLLAQIAS